MKDRSSVRGKADSLATQLEIVYRSPNEVGTVSNFSSTWPIPGVPLIFEGTRAVRGPY